MVRIIPPGGRKSPRKGRRVSTDQQILQGRVEDLAADGRGVVRLTNGKVVMVPRVWPGEEVEVSTRNGADAHLLRILRAAPERRPPPCPHFDQCGGCAWQMVDEDAQAQAKQARVDRLARQRHFAAPLPLWRAPQAWNYRNRAQLRTDGSRLGFVGRDGATLIDIDHCPVLSSGAAAAMSNLRAALPQPDWRARGGALRTWHIDDQLPPRLDSRQPFRQGNSAQNLRMREWVAARFSDGADFRVLELFAGSGNFTQVMSAAGAQVLAVEVVAEAISNACVLPGVEWLAADLYCPASLSVLAERAANCTELVLDPPRAGYPHLSQLVAALPALQRVVYVSCDPATFARDVAPLAALGWVCDELQPVDLFPQTPHVELLSEFRRRYNGAPSRRAQLCR